MTRQFKPVRLTVLIGVTAIIVCGFAEFYTHHSAHGTTAEERAAYEISEKVGEKAPRGATLPAEAELNTRLKSISCSRARLSSSKILLEQLTSRLLNRLSKRVTPPVSKRRMRSGELLTSAKKVVRWQLQCVESVRKETLGSGLYAGASKSFLNLHSDVAFTST